MARKTRSLCRLNSHKKNCKMQKKSKMGKKNKEFAHFFQFMGQLDVLYGGRGSSRTASNMVEYSLLTGAKRLGGNTVLSVPNSLEIYHRIYRKMRNSNIDLVLFKITINYS